MSKFARYPITSTSVRGSQLSAKDRNAVSDAFRKTKVSIVKLGASKKAKSVGASKLTIRDTATGRGNVKLVSGHLSKR